MEVTSGGCWDGEAAGKFSEEGATRAKAEGQLDQRLAADGGVGTQGEARKGGRNPREVTTGCGTLWEGKWVAWAEVRDVHWSPARGQASSLGGSG